MPASKLLHPGGEASRAKAAASWTACATAFLKKEKPESGVEVKVKRLASRHWLAAVDHLLVSLSVGGLFRFATPEGWVNELIEEMQGEPTRSFIDGGEPCLVMVIDQGSVGWSPSFYAIFQLHLRYAVVYDILHRVWNSLKNAFVSAGFWEVALLYGMHASVNYGPFDGAQFGEEVKAAALHHQSLADASCPLFQHYLPDIAADRCETNMLHDDAWVAQVWQECLHHPKLQQKGPRMALARWMSVIDVVAWWDEVYHMRVVRLLYLGIQMGYVDGALSACKFSVGNQQHAVSGSMAGATRCTKVGINKVRARGG